MPRTRLSICQRKRRYASEAEAVTAAIAVAGAADLDLRPYACDRCGHFHLTSRLKGKRRLPVRDAPDASADRPVCAVQDKSGV
jgi:endogenous inhibitor of DNA gyrase (YacG/DUF329 family)